MVWFTLLIVVTIVFKCFNSQCLQCVLRYFEWHSLCTCTCNTFSILIVSFQTLWHAYVWNYCCIFVTACKCIVFWMKIFNNDDLISCRMSPPLWSQMSIVTSFLDHVIIPSFDPLEPIHWPCVPQLRCPPPPRTHDPKDHVSSLGSHVPSTRGWIQR